MSTSFQSGAEPFRLSQLIYDTRYRSITIQIIALIIFVMVVSTLVSNVIANFNEQGIPFSFSFLWSTSFYDISQHLIDYDSTRTHMRAAMVGLLNTLLVAVLGCILATIVGVFVGVLRLSNNWIVARLMTIYVEMFRNVPVLLWIVFFHAIISETLPHPREFREGGGSEMFLGAIAMTKQGFWTPEVLFSRGFGDWHIGSFPISGGKTGNYFAISIDLILILAVMAVSFFVSRWNNRRADAIQAATGDRPTTWWHTMLIWFIPLLAVLWWLGFHLDGPEVAEKGLRVMKGGTEIQPALISLTLALALYTAAFIAEIVRGGIMAISKGQTEASYALGIQPGTTMRLVILPQALRVIIPPLISNYLNLTKNSSLAIAVGYPEITGTLAGITLNQTGRAMETVLLLMGFYLIISLSISAVMNWYNNSVKLKER